MTSREDDNNQPNFDSLMFDDRIDRDPMFEEQTPFEASHVQPLLEKLVHLSRFGNLLTLVLGERGSGKTFLLERLLDAVSEETDVCYIQAQPLLTTDQLFQSIQSELLTSIDSVIDNEQFQQLLSEQEIPIVNRMLVIDDAETLSTEVLRELCALSASEQEKDSPFLKVLLFANHDLTIGIESAATGVLPDTGIYTIDVPGLSELDARDWVESILLAEGYQAQEAEINELIQQGDYNLSQLQSLALDYTDTVPEDDFSDELYEEEEGVSLMGYWFGGLTLVILLIFAGFFYQEEIAGLLFPPEPEVAITDEVIDVSTPIQEAIDNVPQPASVEMEQNTSEASTERTSDFESADELLTNSATSEPDTVIDSNESLTDISEPKTETVLDADIYQVDENRVVETTPTEEPSKPEVEATSVLPQYTAAEMILMNAPAESYVVQIAGLSNPDSIKRLIDAHPDLNLVAYRSLLNSKPWQIVVYGPFESYAIASQKRAELPESLATNKPWLKSIEKVKQEIDAAQASQ